ncbi:peptidoglycan DD-metalloendopeptidase family protein [Kineococcus rhizosphaerae]|uniref:peptidoglycan DD-metalloendopeptidase family protein n=1 Tax=Kineococcus rhizosphaerae TaxID=559628 RepID=UPI0014753260|nr:peptidoglycan DD-metalloendopeptidase family protein [Kineococcus rhizosphaerae]
MLGSALAVAPSAAAADSVVLQVPFPCGQKWVGEGKSPAHVSDHREIDFNLKGTSGNQDKGRPVVAAAAGVVMMSELHTTQDGFGNVIKIRHADGTYTLYAHLDRRDVAAGTTVRQGQPIGTVGNTTSKRPGMAAHLHFEHRRGASQRTLQAVRFDGKAFQYPTQTVTSRNSCSSGSPAAPAAKDYAAADHLDGRLLPEAGRHDVVDQYRRGGKVIVDCRTTGSPAYGSTTWGLTSDHLYVPAALLTYNGRRGLRDGTPVCAKPMPLKATAALDARTGKDRASTSVPDAYRAGENVMVVCTAYGKSTYGDQNTWARTNRGEWVVRAYLQTPGTGLVRGLPRCDLDRSSGSPAADTGARTPVSRLNPSPRIAAFIKSWETLRLRPYDDKAKNGVCTVGWGHALTPHHSCTPAEKASQITRAEAERLFQRDLSAAATGARNLAPRQSYRQHEFDALVSMVFNLGSSFKGPEFREVLANGPAGWDAIPERMRMFVHDGDEHKVVCGLLRRRIDEGAIFARADYASRVGMNVCTDR